MECWVGSRGLRAEGYLSAVDECFLELSEGWADSLMGYVGEYRNLFILGLSPRLCDARSAAGVRLLRRQGAPRKDAPPIAALEVSIPAEAAVSPHAASLCFFRAAGTSSGGSGRS